MTTIKHQFTQEKAPVCWQAGEDHETRILQRYTVDEAFRNRAIRSSAQQAQILLPSLQNKCLDIL